MRPVELQRLNAARRKTEEERTRDKHIRENMWKASQAARKVSSFSGVPFEDLRSVALEAMVKLYAKWDPSKANFSTWLNRSLTYQLLNYLRDGSRMVKFPRAYSDTYMRIRKTIAERPEVTHKELSERTGISEQLISETREAFQMSYVEIDEDTDIAMDEALLEDNSLGSLFGDYREVLERLSDLPQDEYNFLTDVYIHKRAQSTIYRKYGNAGTPEAIKKKTEEIMSKVLNREEDNGQS
jgi:DNA-directed RNA polymerase specialized sigma subunit